MKKVTATLASLALAAGLAAPSAAVANDGEDIAKVIAGIAALAIIAKAVDDRKDRKEAAAKQQSKPVYSHSSRSSSSGFSPVNRDRNQPRYIEEPTFGALIDERARDRDRRGVRANRLPDSCQRLVRTPRGERVVYGARCLNRNWSHAQHLPRSCEVLIETPRGNRLAYNARCLRRDGWRIARR